jgi:hypothetical protein
MAKPRILIQLDTDAHPSVFDRVVAVDAGVEHLFSYGGVKPDQVEGLVHGAIFTRSPSDAQNTAIFVGGSDMDAGERILATVKEVMNRAGMRVSAMLDSNGSNTTAAAAVRAAAKHMDIGAAQALVLGGTGPVGQRAALLLARAGAHVRVGSRQIQRAEAVCQSIRAKVPNARLEAVATATSADGPKALAERDLVIAAGAAGVVLLPQKLRAASSSLRVAIDLNAVPPVGIEGVEVFDKGVSRDGVVCYGAIGVGGSKMKLHRAAIAKLFERNDQILDAEEIYDLAVAI